MTAPTACVLLVGGQGSRMQPLTATRPKHLLPVGGVPLIDLVVRRLVERGVRRIALATAIHADRIAEHARENWGELREDGLTWHLSREIQPLGTGGALTTASRLLEAGDEPVLVVNGDLLTGHDVAAQTSLATDADVVLHVRPAEDPRPFGTVRCDDQGRVHAFAEKVAGPPGTLVNAGTYVVGGDILAALDHGTHASWEREVLPGLIADGVGVRAYAEDAWFADVGTPAALLAANRAALDGSARDALPAGYRPDRAVDPSAMIDPTAQLSGSSVSAACRIGSQAVVADSVVLPHTTIGAGATVEASVLGAGVVIGEGARVSDCALGDGALVASGVSMSGAQIAPGGAVS